MTEIQGGLLHRYANLKTLMMAAEVVRQSLRRLSNELWAIPSPTTKPSMFEPASLQPNLQPQMSESQSSHFNRDMRGRRPRDPGCTEVPYFATSQDTWILGTMDDLEDLEGYQAGGYHPVHPGDILDQNGRYRVLRKLGYGGFSTVWLCRDDQKSIFIAIKIHSADVKAEKLKELELKHLKGIEYAHINVPLDHFTLDGPNGTHHCLVNSLMGPCVSPDLGSYLSYAALSLRNMCRQATLAMRFLHQNGICHGDFRPNNILLKLADSVNDLHEDQLLSILDSRRKGYSKVYRKDNKELPSGTPSHLYYNVDLFRLIDFFTEDICVIDFGESFPVSAPPPDLGIPLPYRAPELHFEEGEIAIGQACDLWALACTLYAIRYQADIFGAQNEPSLMDSMARLFGRFPARWCITEDHSSYYQLPRDHRIIVAQEGVEQDNFDFRLQIPLAEDEIFPECYWRPEDTIQFDASLVELEAIKETLLMLFRYEPSERISADEVLQLNWLRDDLSYESDISDEDDELNASAYWISETELGENMETWVELWDPDKKLKVVETYSAKTDPDREAQLITTDDVESILSDMPTSFHGASHAPEQSMAPAESLPCLSILKSAESLSLGLVHNDELEVTHDLEFADGFDAEEKLLIKDTRKVISKPEIMEKPSERFVDKTWTKKGKWRVRKQRLGRWLKSKLCGGLAD